MWLSYKIGTQFGVSVFEGSRIPWNVSVSVISVLVRPLYVSEGSDAAQATSMTLA